MVEVTDANFQSEILNSSVPALVDFWAVWCAPCRAIAPHVEALAKEYEGKVRVGKCDIDSNPERAEPVRRAQHPDADGVQGAARSSARSSAPRRARRSKS